MFFYRIQLLKVVIILFCFFENFALHSMSLYRGLEMIIAAISKPNHTPVFMNHSNIIELPKTGKDTIISTGGLVGCLSTFLYVKSNYDQKQRVILTHYSWGNYDHVKEIREQIRQLQLRTDHKKFDYAHFCIIGPTGNNPFIIDIQENALIEQQQIMQLQQVVKSSLSTHYLDMTNVYYKIPVPGQIPAQVHVVLSNDEKSPSYCKIYTNGCLEKTLLLSKE